MKPTRTMDLGAVPAPLRDEAFRLLLVPVACGLLLAWNGAGDIARAMPMASSMAYWASAALVVWLLAHFSTLLMGWLFRGRRLPLFLVLLLGIVASSPLISVALHLLTDLTAANTTLVLTRLGERFDHEWPFETVRRGVGAFLLWPTINTLWFRWRGLRPPYEFIDVPKLPPQDIPADVGSAPTARAMADVGAELKLSDLDGVVALEAEDHFVRVHRKSGRPELLGGKFGHYVAAMEAHALGHRVHRSWWVNFSCIRAVKRKGRSVELVLTTELTVPVSESHKALIGRFRDSRH